MIFKEQLTNISTVLNNTGNTTKLLTSFSALDASQQKVLLSSKLLTEEQKEQCIVMSMLSSANTKYTAEQLSKTAGISAETLANWGLTSSTDTLTVSELAEKAATDAQAKSALEKIVAQNAQAVANGELTASNVALATSETGSTLATGAFTTAIKANISAMKTWLLSTPAGWITMLVGGIFLAVKAYDALTVSVEEQKEKMEDSLSAYNDAKSELENITTELDNQEQAMDELLGKEKLTYAEKGQLEELQQITEELRIQKDLAEKEEGRTQKEVASDAATLFQKQFGKYDISDEAIDEYQTNANITGNNAILVSDENDLSAMIAGYKQFNDLLDEVYGEKNQEDIDHFTSLTEDLKDSIFSTAQDLQTQQDNMSDYYNTIKDIPYDELTSDQKEVVDAYTTISNAIALIYKELDPNSWNEMQIDKLFTTDGIEKTKDELVEMAKEGTLDESTIQSYSKLNSTLEDSNMILNDGQSAASALCDEMYALADAEDDVQSSKLNETPISQSISTTVDQLNTRLKPAMDSLASAWENVFSGDNGALNLDDLDLLSTVDTIKSKLDELNKIEGIEVDYSSFENFVKVLENTESSEDDVKEAFNELAQSIVDAGVSGAEDFETLKESLEDLGVVNNEIIAFQALVSNTELLNNSISEAGLTMDDFVDYTEDGSIVATEAAQAFIEEMVGAENATQALALLQLQQVLVNENSLNTTDDINACLALAQAAGVAVEALSWLSNISAQYDAAVASGDTVAQKNLSATMETIKTKIQSEVANFQPDINFDGSKGSKSASKAGKEAADAYIEAFEKELKQLQDDKDNGIITEKQYLDALRRLYNKYFRDKKKYLDQYKKYERQYLEGMKSLYESAFSYLTSKIDKKIDAINDEKDAAIDALEAEKDAAIDALEAQKKAAEDAYQSQIDLLEEKKKSNQEVIDGIQDEIDAINDTNEARKRDLDLQKAQYELEKARNQRTILQYDEKSGMHYVKDDSAERSAKESVDDANREIQIADLEKQKKYYEDINDSIDEQISSLNDLIDKSNEYYDDLIEQTEKSYDAQIEAMEKYYDSLIDALEKQKEQFQSLTDLVEEAQMEALLKELGINEEALLNGSTEEFNKLRDAYLGIIKDMNAGNQGVLDSLTELSGVDMNNLTGYLDSTAESFDGLGSSMGNVTDKTGELDNVSNSLGSVSDNAGNASTEMSNLKTASDGLNESLPNVSQQLSDISAIDSENINATTTAFNNLADAIGKVATALGIGAEDSVGGLLSTLQSLNEVSLGGEDGEGIISQFENLKTAIDAVSSAIGGGGGESSGGNGDPLAGGGNGKKDKSGGGTGGDSSSVTSALDSLKAKADEVLGEGSEDNSEGSGVIGQFGQLKAAVDDVSSAIGTEGSETDSQNQDESTLSGAITNLGATTEEVLGESGGEGVIGRFEQFKDVIGEANAHVTGISDGLDAIDGQEVECTITVNIKQNGNLPAGFGAWTGTAMNLESGSYNAKYGKGLVDGTAHVEGTAKVTGDWGVHQGGQALLGELGREIIVRQGRFFTVGENGAEMHNLQPGDIVFNHIQTEELLKNGHISSRGKAYANGTANKPSVLDRLRAQGYEVQKYEWKDMYGNLISPQQMNEAAKAWVSGTYECLTPMNDFKEKIKETVKVIEGANVVNNTMNQQPINVTMGDIHLHEVQDVDGLSKAIIHQMPGKMLQAIHQK